MSVLSSRWLPAAQTYLRQSLRFDLLAGLTVAMVVLPQSMAYAAIAGVNPIYGIYTAILPAMIASLFGSSKHLATGPTNAAAMVTFSVLIAYSGKANYQEYVFVVSILCGAIILILGLLRLGGIIRYVSNSVLTGFLAGATVLIVLGQLGNLFGLKIAKDLGAFGTVWAVIQNLPAARWEGLATAGISIAVMVLFPRLTRRVPAALVTVILASVVVAATNWQAAGVKLVSDLNLPANPGVAFHLPQIPLAEWPDLLAGAGAVALLIVVEAISIAKSIGLNSGQRINPSREFIGQGLASLVGGFFQCYPAAGSLSRSAVNYAAGAQTRMAGMSSGAFVWLALLLFANWIGYIPVPSLAAVVVVSALGLVNREHIRTTWRASKFGPYLMIITGLATLVINLETAIYLGVLLSIVIYLYETGKLEISYLLRQSDGSFIEKSLNELCYLKPAVAVVNVQGSVYFGAVEDLENALDEVLKSGVKVIVLRVRNIKSLGSTGVTALQGIQKTACKQNVRLILSGVTPELGRMLQVSGLSSKLGEANIFNKTDRLFESTHQALDFAMQHQNGCQADLSIAEEGLSINH